MRKFALLSVLAFVGCSSSPKLDGTWTRAEWDKGSGWEEGPESHLNFSDAGTLRNWGVRATGDGYDKLQKFFVRQGVMYRCSKDSATCTADNSVYSSRLEFTSETEFVLYDGINVDKASSIKHRYRRGE